MPSMYIPYLTATRTCFYTLSYTLINVLFISKKADRECDGEITGILKYYVILKL